MKRKDAKFEPAGNPQRIFAARRLRSARPSAKTLRLTLALASLAFAFAHSATSSPALPIGPKPLKKVGVIELPGPAGKPFGSLALDPQTHLLFCAHADAGSLYVVDVMSGKWKETIPGLPGVRGVAFAEGLRKIYASVSGEDSIAVMDSTTLRVVKTIPTEASPGAMTYAAPFGKLFVSDEVAGALAVVDTQRDAVVNMIRFGGRVGTPQFDPAAQRVYVNLPGANEIAAVDPATEMLLSRNPVGRCKGNTGMALDPDRGLAFLACEENNLLAVYDLRSNQVLDYLPMAAGGANVALDRSLGRVYVACVSGAISVYEEEKAGRCRKMCDYSAAHAVHSLAVDPATHRIYVPEQEEDGVPVARLVVYEARQ